ncbi:putative NUDIX family NTP pyrophosphohydrolase [Diaminobutyricimonas aerilata]|uniref:Putative NUDIX family NTP pyrophosphohydrolase n=1 Tax=Diaminobutyricimonas aerilata TaxID=1162967 RepID=A0A2M9CJ08_9MICO|nr:NUDIX domain-containing protein [Diaminobutyricimonas aerilata]PJJ71896.1 putative NUDIX family NTP pyrophosphohydrolase [Diaminobutyricimonas aerilata]
MVLSAGLLLYRGDPPHLEVLIAHMGGPFWRHKDAGAWSIPKGEVEPGEDPLDAARREFTEELGVPAPDGDPVPLGEVRQSNGKTVIAWAVRADLDPASIRPGTFELELPRGSGRTITVPEIDRVGWFEPAVAVTRLVRAQGAFVERLVERLSD